MYLKTAKLYISPACDSCDISNVWRQPPALPYATPKTNKRLEYKHEIKFDLMNVIYNVGNWPGWLTIDMLACAKHLQDGLSMSRSHSVNALVRANGQTISFELATSHSMY